VYHITPPAHPRENPIKCDPNTPIWGHLKNIFQTSRKTIFLRRNRHIEGKYNVRIELFGTLRVLKEDTVVTHFRDRNGELLLARLAIKPESQLMRYLLYNWLWENNANPGNRLSWTLTQLKNTLGEDIVLRVGQKSVGLKAGITSDVADFERACGMARHAQKDIGDRLIALDEALTLSQNEFLTGFVDNWTIGERARLEDKLFDTLVAVLQACEAAYKTLEATSLRNTAHQRFPERPLPPPPPPSAPLPSTSLGPLPPPTGNGFFGRASEVATLYTFANSPQTNRFFTIVGTGGMGKTRLMREALLSHPKSLGFISLVERINPNDIWDALRDMLKLPATGFGPVNERVIAHLQTHNNALLLIDNVEHLLGNRETPDETLPEAIATLLAACPTLKIVITSRRAMKIKGETLLTLDVLPLRDAESLFLDRARAVNPHFAQTPTGLKHVREICDLLEWVPLALEIAAARAYLVTPAEMERELTNLLTFLNTKRPRGEARHSSVRVALEWSYNLLDTEAKRVFRQTGVFRGGFTLEGIRAVADNLVSVLDALEDLLLHSLLTATPDDWARRYTSLETVRELAALLLAQDAIEEADALTKHADFYVVQAKGIGSLIEKSEWEEATNILRAERANLSSVVNYATKKRDATTLDELLQSLAHACLESGYWQDMDRLLDASEALFEEHDAAMVNVFRYRAVLSRWRGDDETAWKNWQRALFFYEQHQQIDRVRSIRFEIASQAIDEKRWVEVDILLCALQEMSKQIAFSPNDNLALTTFLARFAFGTEKYEIAHQYALCAFNYRTTIGVTEGQRINVALYLCPILQKVNDWQTLKVLITETGQYVLQSQKVFLFGKLLLETGQFYLSTQQRLLAIQSFWVAEKIHSELQSRRWQESQQRLAESINSYGNIPEIKTWLDSTNGKTWGEIYSSTKLLPSAHDLHTLSLYSENH
jgi:predicted ATPase